MHHQPQQVSAPPGLRERLAQAGVDLLLHGPDPDGQPTTGASTSSPLVSSGVALSGQDVAPMVFHVIDVAAGSGLDPILEQITVNEWSAQDSRWTALPAHEWHAGREARRRTASPADALQPMILVGHEAELERLRLIFHPANLHDPEPVRCMITGGPGAGKTALFRRFAMQNWTKDRASGDNYVVLRSVPHPKTPNELVDQLLEQSGSESIETATARLVRNRTVLVVDDVDSPAQMDAVHALMRHLPTNIALLLIGRMPVLGKENPSRWEVIELGPLSEADVERMLVLTLQRNNVAIPNADVKAIVAALNGLTGPVRLVGEHLTDAASAARLLGWLGAGNAAVPPGGFPWLLKALASLFEYRWHAHLGEEGLDNMSMLAHGPVSGFSASLGLDLTGFRGRSAHAATIGHFERICKLAVAAELLRQDGPQWRFAYPAIIAWLRARARRQRATTMRRWTKWIATRLAGPPKSRERSWRELNELPVALLEWLETCSIESARLVRPVCVAYAIAHGPLDAWQRFCLRIMQAQREADADIPDWYFTLAQIAHANEDTNAALSAVDRYLALARGPDRPDRTQAEIDTAVELRDRILASQGSSMKFPAQPPGAPDNTAAAEKAMLIRHHQQRLADAALEATLHAEPGTRSIGLVVQALGTGLMGTLVAYLAAYQRSGLRAGSRFVVVADRIDAALELAHTLMRVDGGFDVVRPETANELAAVLGTRRPTVVVTTEQKLRLLRGAFSGDDLVVGFGLHRPSLELLVALPGARMIVFAHESLMFGSPLPAELGPVVASYGREEAADDGYLGPVKVQLFGISGLTWEWNPAAGHGRRLTEAGIGLIIVRIRDHWLQRHAESTCKGVVIAEYLDDVARFGERLPAELGLAVTKVMVLTGGVNHKQEILADFRNSTGSVLLVTTPAIAAGLSLSGVHACYVATLLTPAVQLRLEYFVNRLGPAPRPGEILDFVENDWSILQSRAAGWPRLEQLRRLGPNNS